MCKRHLGNALNMFQLLVTSEVVRQSESRIFVGPSNWTTLFTSQHQWNKFPGHPSLNSQLCPLSGKRKSQAVSFWEPEFSLLPLLTFPQSFSSLLPQGDPEHSPHLGIFSLTASLSQINTYTNKVQWAVNLLYHQSQSDLQLVDGIIQQRSATFSSRLYPFYIPIITLPVWFSPFFPQHLMLWNPCNCSQNQGLCAQKSHIAYSADIFL